ncbi:MAG: hypothetical protein KAH18_08595 [Psychromonas sp.]|nr:hypothetical protein [Psychromonas sp.]
MITCIFDVSDYDLEGFNETEKTLLIESLNDAVKIIEGAMRHGDLMFENDPESVQRIIAFFGNKGEEGQEDEQTIGMVVYHLMRLSCKLMNPNETLRFVDNRGDPQFPVSFSRDILRSYLSQRKGGFIICIRDDTFFNELLPKEHRTQLMLAELFAAVLGTKQAEDVATNLGKNNDRQLEWLSKYRNKSVMTNTETWVTFLFRCKR